MSFNVNASLFRAVALAVSKEETRYYLKGVYIEPAKDGMPGATLTATDGHMLLSAYDPTGTCDAPVIVALNKAALTACKLPRTETLDRRVIGDAFTSPASVAYSETLTPIAISPDWCVDGSFPNWRQVVPRDVSAQRVASFAPKYLARFAEVADTLGSTAVKIAGADDASPALVTFSDREDIFGVLMPRRDTCPATLPAFV